MAGSDDADVDAQQAKDETDLVEMLSQLRVLLPTAQLLSAFLVTVPFTQTFAQIVRNEQHVFLATFVLSVASLILFSAPAVQHRLLRPLRDKARFKVLATRQIVAGSAALSGALVTSTQLVTLFRFRRKRGVRLFAPRGSHDYCALVDLSATVATKRRILKCTTSY